MLSDLYTPKQLDTFHFAVNNDYFMLINHGAKRTGKTVLDNDLFLYELRRIKKIAAAQGVENPQYILAGADLGALNRNVLIELSNKYGIEFHFDKFNRFKLFGVQVCCFGHSKINDLGRIRGMTAYGAYINEGTMAKQEVFDEIDNERVTNVDEEQMKEVPIEKLIKETNGLIRAAAYKKRIEVQNRDNYEAGLEAVKSLVFEAMAKENPELYRQVSAYLNKKKNEGLEG